jgi:hypothetical protein
MAQLQFNIDTNDNTYTESTRSMFAQAFKNIDDILRSLALKGRRFETWAEIAQAVERATTYWNEHKHSFIWGRRRRHRTLRRFGLAAVPAVSRI